MWNCIIHFYSTLAQPAGFFIIHSRCNPSRRRRKPRRSSTQAPYTFATAPTRCPAPRSWGCGPGSPRPAAHASWSSTSGGSDGCPGSPGQPRSAWRSRHLVRYTMCCCAESSFPRRRPTSGTCSCPWCSCRGFPSLVRDLGTSGRCISVTAFRYAILWHNPVT